MDFGKFDKDTSFIIRCFRYFCEVEECGVRGKKDKDDKKRQSCWDRFFVVLTRSDRMVGKDGFEVGEWVENFNRKHKAKLAGKNVVYSTKKNAKGSIKKWGGLEALKDKNLVMKVDQSKLKDFITHVYGIKYPEPVQERDLDAGPKAQRQANLDELPGFGIQRKGQSQPEPIVEPKTEPPKLQVPGSRTKPKEKPEVDPEMSPEIESAQRTDRL